MDERNNLPQLPKGWTWTRLGDILDRVEKTDPRIRSEKEFDYLDIASIDNTQQKITNPKKYFGKDAPSRARQVVKVGDILFSTVRTYLKNIAVVPSAYDGQIASTGFCVIRPSGGINSTLYFLLAQTNDFLNPLNELQRGTSYPAVRDSDVFSQFVPVPPLPEQRRIVAKIEELFSDLDAGIAALKKVQAQLKRYRQAVLKAAVEGKLTAEWRAAYRGEIEPASALLERIRAERAKNASGKAKALPTVDVSELGELPEGWEWATLGEIATFKNGINFSGSQKGEKGIPTIDVFNMYSKGIYVNLENLYRVNVAPKTETLLKQGDILFVRSSVKREGVGWASIFKETEESITFCGFIIRARLHTADLSPEYLTYFLRTDSSRAQIVGRSSQVTITNISQDSLGKVPVSLPSLAEQQQIVAEVERRLSVADEVERTVDASLKQAERLRQSILWQAFAGKLVPQDPSDEPAERLLERIRAGRGEDVVGARHSRKRS